VSLSAQLTSEQQKEIVVEANNTDKTAREVQEQVDNGKEVLDPEDTSSVPNMVLNTLNNNGVHKCLVE